VVERGAEELVGGVLEGLRSLSEDIHSCVVLSADGELLASLHEPGVDRERAQAMLAALVNLAARIAARNGRQYAEQVRVRTEEGSVFLVRLPDGGTLAATAGPDAREGLILYDMRNARARIERGMGEGS
jgi:predicted regulator of Ras-like GTPase activity (Roadblock/LC7/MglB family)